METAKTIAVVPEASARRAVAIRDHAESGSPVAVAAAMQAIAGDLCGAVNEADDVSLEIDVSQKDGAANMRFRFRSYRRARA